VWLLRRAGNLIDSHSFVSIYIGPGKEIKLVHVINDSMKKQHYVER
jgi:hypothetical protein